KWRPTRLAVSRLKPMRAAAFQAPVAVSRAPLGVVNLGKLPGMTLQPPGPRAAKSSTRSPSQPRTGSLPLASFANLTNPGNGRSVIVKINGRGPYARGRMLDLAPCAADALGVTRQPCALGPHPAFQRDNQRLDPLLSDGM